jgi:DNA-directed RNA polymerase subunit K/omega
MTLKQAKNNHGDEATIKKEEILERAQSAYEAVVAIAKEARRLNAAPGIYLKGDEKPIPMAVRNFTDGKVGYEVDKDKPARGMRPEQGKRMA